MSTGALIGIDIGTAHCCVGVWRNGRVDIIPTDEQTNTMPSIVAFTDSGRLIGNSTINQGVRNLGNTIFDIKKLIGRKFADLPVQSFVKPWPFKVIPGPGDKPRVEIRHGGVPEKLAPEEILSMIFVKLKEMAESRIGSEVGSAVCTVPVSFTIAQRQATRDAAAIAGLKSVTIISETSAAAIAYCMNRNCFNTQKKVLIFDLGASTCSTSVLRINGNKIEVKASFGSDELGGDHFVNNMVKYFADKLERERRNINGDAAVLKRLWDLCEKAKKDLSGNMKAGFEIDIDSSQVLLEISRAEFELLNLHLFKKCMNLVEKCIREAGVSKSDVDEIVLVGGSTRIKMIAQLLSEMFDGKKVCQSLNADEAVAIGATIHTACSSRAVTYNEDNIYKLTKVTPRTLGFERDDGLMTMMIPRNTTLPCKKVQRAFASGLPCIDKKTRVIRVYEGDKVRARDNQVVGALDVSWSNGYVSDIIKTDFGSNMCFEMSTDGTLKVSWEDRKSKNKSTSIILTVGLSDDEIGRMVKRCHQYKIHDEMHAKINEARNSLESLANRKEELVNKKFPANKSRKDAKKRNSVVDAVVQVHKWLKDNPAAELRKIQEKKEEFATFCDSVLN